MITLANPSAPQHRSSPHRYYDPIRALSSSDISNLDLHDHVAVAAHKPILSPDRALTAFCQLAAMKLDVKRAMLFFFDARHGYVLAEATKSSSFRVGERAEGDELWLGQTVVPLGFSVCEHTVNLPQNVGSNRQDGTANIAHVVNDLAGDIRFCNRPYVTEGPMVRFYAGVPITTPAGVNIGALCALDDKPHPGIDAHAIDQLVDLSAAVMSHLEALRAKAEFQRGSIMLTGLNSFLDRMTDTQDGPTIDDPLIGISTYNQSTAQFSSKSAEQDPMPATHASFKALSAPVTCGAEAVAESKSVEPSRKESIDDEQPEITARDFLDQSTVDGKSDATRNRMFTLAAKMILESMDVDGVAFYDTSPLYKTSAESRHGQQHHMAYPTSSGNNTTGDESTVSLTAEGSKAASAKEHGLCHMLASAFSAQGAKSRPPSNIMSRRFLKLLNRRYDSGKIWILSADQDQADAISVSSSSQISESHSSSHSEGTRRRTNRTQEVAFIRRLLPQAQQVLFLPVWDHVSGRWTAGTLMYTYSDRRSFSTDVELRFMRAFCDVVMAELGRMDAQALANAKSTFVSSISHELRTPLHGILGTVEYLHDQHKDDASSDLISQIDTCANAMLDIVNHILDYSHVNTIVQDYHVSSHNEVDDDDILQHPAPVKLSQQARSRQQPKMNLDRATEEIIGSALYSFDFDPNQSQRDRSKVTTILDIEQGPLVDWTCRMATGAWKRVCINLVTNALKYTDEGFINITLRQERSIHAEAQTHAILIVADSGKGMSKEFMEASLFRPFEQEDEMSSGTGLGMSLVARIVKAMGGDISVRAKQNVGTTVTVSVPLVQTHRAVPRQVQAGEGHETTNGFRPDLVSFVGPSWHDDSTMQGRGRQKLRSSLHGSIDQIVNSVSGHGSSQPQIHFNIVAEEDLEWLLSQMQARSSSGHDEFGSLLEAPLLIVHRSHQTRIRNESLTAALREIMKWHTESIVGPYGSFQIAKALQACMQAAHRPFKLTSTYAARPDVQEAPKRPRLRKRVSSNKSKIPMAARQAPSNMPPQPSTGSGDTQTLAMVSALSVSTSTQPRQPAVDGPSPAISPGTTDTPIFQTPDVKYLSEYPTPVATLSHRPPLPGTRASYRQQPHQLSILLVDDNEINMRLLIMYAKKMGYDHITAANGLEAIDAYQATLLAASGRWGQSRVNDNPTANSDGGTRNSDRELHKPWPQVILMDISMPKCNGFEATRQIRALESKSSASQRRTFIIAMTGLGSETARREAMVSGMDLFLTKPVRFKELSEILEARPWLR